MGWTDSISSKTAAIVRDGSLSASETIAQLDGVREESARLAIKENGQPHYDESNSTPGLSDFFWATWEAILNFAVEDRSAQPRLVDLIKAAKANSRNEGWMLANEPVRWSTLPVWGMYVRDKLNGIRIDPSKPDEEDVLSNPDIQAVLSGSSSSSPSTPILQAAATARDQWLALHNFLATLWMEADVDHALFALWSARDALEYPPTSPGRPGSQALGPRALRLEATAQWFIGAAGKMYKEKRVWGPKGDENWDKNAGAPGRGGDLWKGNDGYDEGRWALWKKSWEGVVKGEGKEEGPNVVAAAKAALDVIARIESQA